jgi:amino acid transporter
MSTYKMSLFDAILMNMNIMIGGGIFAGPAMMAMSAGNASFLAWPVTALIFLPLVLSTAQVMRLFPEGGGMFRYTESGLGSFFGFIGAWIYVMGYTFVGAVQLFLLYNTVKSSYGQFFLTESKLFFYLLMIAVMLFLTTQSVKLVSMIQSYCTLIKLVPLIALIVLFPFQYNAAFFVTSAELSHLGAAVAPWALFGFLGFEACCGVTHLIQNGEKNGPRALLIGFFGVVGIYTLFHFGVLHVMGVQNLIQYTAAAFARFVIAPAPIVTTLDFMILSAMTITFFASLLGIIFGNVSFIQTLVQKDLFIGGDLLKTENKQGRPWVLLLIQAALIFKLTFFLDNVNLLGQSANLCLFTGFLYMFVSLIKQNYQAGRMKDVVMNCCAILIAIGILGYTIAGGSAPLSGTLLSLIPAAVLSGIGVFLYRNAR